MQYLSMSHWQSALCYLWIYQLLHSHSGTCVSIFFFFFLLTLIWKIHLPFDHSQIQNSRLFQISEIHRCIAEMIWYWVTDAHSFLKETQLFRNLNFFWKRVHIGRLFQLLSWPQRLPYSDSFKTQIYQSCLAAFLTNPSHKLRPHWNSCYVLRDSFTNCDQHWTKNNLMHLAATSSRNISLLDSSDPPDVTN